MQSVLDILKNAGGYVSGESISEALGISRAAVWKRVGKLKTKGYVIESVTNRGYRLVLSPDIITEDVVKSGLTTDFIGRNIFLYDETDSTNNEAKRNSSKAEGSVFIAEVQTGGKGRLGKGWESESGVGVWMSVLLKPEVPPSKVSQITLMAGLAVCRALGSGAKIKWPNDVVIGAKKVCGILAEMSAEVNMVNYVVCGIGVNVNTASYDGELREKATSLFMETNKKHNRADIVSRILNEIEVLYKDFQINGLKNILPEYKQYCVTLDRDVRVIYKSETLTARAVDIAEDGSLIVDKDGEKIIVSSGDVSVRGIYGYV